MKNKYKKLLVGLTIFSMLFGVIGIVPQVKAADTLTDASILLSDSEIDATGVTHTVSFTTNSATEATGYWDIIYPAPWTAPVAGLIDCPAGGVASRETTTAANDTARCTFAGGVALATTTAVTLNTMTNQAAGSYAIEIQKRNSSDVLEERVEVRIQVISDVYMTARVDSLLTFTISGLDSGEVVNGVTCNATSTATTTPFGTLNSSASTTVCQELTVATNASNGFTVTVQADAELTSSGGDTINSFNNSPDTTGSTTPQAWTAPTGLVGLDHTYGHMGLTSEDSSLSGGDTFADGLYVGFNSTDNVEVFFNAGVANGASSGDDIGQTQVAYTTEISALQEAGDYETYLTYIATPTY